MIHDTVGIGIGIGIYLNLLHANLHRCIKSFMNTFETNKALLGPAVVLPDPSLIPYMDSNQTSHIAGRQNFRFPQISDSIAPMSEITRSSLLLSSAAAANSYVLLWSWLWLCVGSCVPPRRARLVALLLCPATYSWLHSCSSTPPTTVILCIGVRAAISVARTFI